VHQPPVAPRPGAVDEPGSTWTPAPRSAAGAAEVPLLSADEMRAWDRSAIDRTGVPERVLMESAGRAAAHVIQRLYPRGRVVAAVGQGNNGGDALVALRTLRAWGREVAAVPVGDAEVRSPLLHDWEIPLHRGDPARAFGEAAVLVDGILGTGARGAPREAQARCIEALNRAGPPIVALDGPSGLDFSTGRAEGAVVRASATVTFGAPKRGLLLYPGRTHCGRILAVEIGFPPLEAGQASAAVITSAWARARLPAVAPDAHKGRMGDVVVVAGSRGVAGAAALVGTGAARAGAGKVYLLSTAENRQILQLALPEALFHDRDAQGADELLARADAVVVGPGMGTDESATELLRRVLRHGDSPLVLDADALTLISREPHLLEDGSRPCLLTPHPGEMARLLRAEVSQITEDPFGSLQRGVERWGHAVLLKGAPSLVLAPGQRVLANVAGHSGIATGGMGDTLAGVAGALLAVGCSPYEAGALALHFTGRAAELAGRGRSLLPRDVADHLADAFAAPDPVGDTGLPEVILDLPAPA
jgi:ADP-dependent NAD(P)H-hydrate dehydratase / NAD(P)H-hydrate epimerase